MNTTRPDPTASRTDDDDRHRSGRRFTEIGTASALAFSLLALVTSVYQTGLMQKQTELLQVQSRASVWPYISIGENRTDKKGEEQFAWRIDNNGVGPAKIESVVVSVDGKPYTTWQKALAALSPAHPFHGSQTSINGTVLPPSVNRETMIEMAKPADHELAADIIAGRERVQIQVCYCSVYDDCWIAKFTDREPKPTPRCESAGVNEFED